MLVRIGSLRRVRNALDYGSDRIGRDYGASLELLIHGHATAMLPSEEIAIRNEGLSEEDVLWAVPGIDSLDRRRISTHRERKGYAIFIYDASKMRCVTGTTYTFRTSDKKAALLAVFERSPKR